MRKLIYCCLFVACLSAFTNCSTDSSDSKLYVDSDTTNTKKNISLYETDSYDKEISLSKLVKSVDIVKLKVATDPNSVIAKPQRIFLLNDKFYIWDKKFAGLKVFDSNGTFLYQIGKVGKGPGEYIRIHDVQLINPSQFVLLCDNTKLQYYTPEGKYLKTDQLGLFATSFSFQGSGDNLFYINGNFSDKSKQCNVVLLDSSKEPIKRYFDVKTKEIIPSYDYTGFLHAGTKTPLYAIPYDDKIWGYNDGKFTVAYKFDLGADKLPDDIIHKNTIPKQKYRNEAGYIGNDFFETEKYAFFSFKNKNMVDYGILNRETNTLNITSALKNEGDYLANIFSTPLGVYNDTLLLGFVPERITYLQENKKQYVASLKDKNKMLYDLISTYKPTENLVILKLALK